MRLIRGLHHLKPFSEGCVITIGNFDGVHLGHCAVIEQLSKRSQELHLPSVVMIFEPQPLEYFLHDNAPSRLMRLREKAIQFDKLPIVNVLTIKFNQVFANQTAEQFIESVLVKKLNVKHIVIGDDFHFGKMRRGNFAMLQEKGLQYGFSVEDSGSFLLENERVSSTLIRDALIIGDLKTAKRLLGRDYSVCGRIAHGNKLGRQLGFPTANILMFRENTPIQGVFAVTMTGIDNQEFYGVANVGIRPTINGASKVILETHLFNFNQNIYGRYVVVHFKEKIRDEMRFDSLNELQQQIQKDINTAKKCFHFL